MFLTIHRHNQLSLRNRGKANNDRALPRWLARETNAGKATPSPANELGMYSSRNNSHPLIAYASKGNMRTKEIYLLRGGRRISNTLNASVVNAGQLSMVNDRNIGTAAKARVNPELLHRIESDTHSVCSVLHEDSHNAFQSCHHQRRQSAINQSWIITKASEQCTPHQ